MLHGPQPLGAMMGAVLMATQKPVAAEALKQVHALLEQVPDDVDFLKFQAGVARYVNQPPRTPRAAYPVLAQVGRVSLRDAGGAGKPLLMVPSMVNRGYVLDLAPGHSMVEAMRNAGHRVLLVDWGVPDPAHPLTLEQVIADHLEPLVGEAAERFGPVPVFGYCMGGILALAAAVRLGPARVERLAVAAMPWDFSITPTGGTMPLARPVVEPYLSTQALVPPEAMQQYFWLLDPWSPVRRLMAYGTAAEALLPYLTALEDWLADGLALDGPIVKEMLVDWYGDNRTLKGQWHVRGARIAPQDLTIPVWAAVTQKDVLVPAMCSLPFTAQAKGITIAMADTGHVGLVCGRRAPEQLYGPLAAWLSGTV